MDEGDQKRQLIDEQTEGTGRLRSGVEGAREGGDAARPRVEESRADSARPGIGGAENQRPGIGGARAAVEDTVWFIRRRIAWPIEDAFDQLGRRGAIGVFGGGGIAVAGVVAALVVASPGGADQSAATTEAFVTPQRTPAPAPAAVRPAPKPKKHEAKPTGPTLHGAPPDFSPAKDVQAGVGDGRAVDGEQGDAGEAPAKRGAADGNPANGGAAADENGAGATDATASSNEAPTSTAKIGATPAASAAAQAKASSLAKRSDEGAAGSRAGRADGTDAPGNAAGAGLGADGVERGTGAKGAGTGEGSQAGATGAGAGEGSGPRADGARDEFTGPPAPRAAKKVARRFAEAFVVYEVGGIDTKVRKAFNQTSTKQLSRSLLHRPPRQPASVKVPRAKVVNVVAGPSKGKVYTVSVSLLRVGVTSELRLEMEQGVGKKWQVTNVFG